MKKALIFFTFLFWLTIAVAGSWFLLVYKNTPGKAAAAPTDWPVDSSITRDPEKMTLIMIAHPRCPCTRATLRELSRVMAQTQGKLKTYVLFIRPEGFPADWEKSDLWTSAEEITDVTVMVDDKGVEAERFQAATSGQNLLYSSDGKLLFNGGITFSRGHEGSNAGQNSIISIVNGEQPIENVTPVYGCLLFAADKNELNTEVSR